MRVIFTNSFLKKELKPLEKYYSVNDIKKAVSKINAPINLSSLGYKDCKLVKLRISGKAAGRIIAYIYIKNNWIVPLVFRLKKDKIFGENLSINNKKAKALILKMMDLSMDDIAGKKYVVK